MKGEALLCSAPRWLVERVVVDMVAVVADMFAVVVGWVVVGGGAIIFVVVVLVAAAMVSPNQGCS